MKARFPVMIPVLAGLATVLPLQVSAIPTGQMSPGSPRRPNGKMRGSGQMGNSGQMGPSDQMASS